MLAIVILFVGFTLGMFALSLLVAGSKRVPSRLTD